VRNNETLCNNLLPMRAPCLSEGDYRRGCEEFWENLQVRECRNNIRRDAHSFSADPQTWAHPLHVNERQRLTGQLFQCGFARPRASPGVHV